MACRQPVVIWQCAGIFQDRYFLLAVWALGEVPALLVLVHLHEMVCELVRVKEYVETDVAGENAPLVLLYQVGPEKD